MKVEELAAQCIEAINHPERSIPEEPLITLVGKKTLFPKGGGPRPFGLACENAYGEKVWWYSARKVLAALATHGLVKIVPENGNSEAPTL